MRRTSPAWDARSATSLSRAGSRESVWGIRRLSAPSSSPWCRTSKARSPPGSSGRASPATRAGPAGPPSGGQVASARSSRPIRSHTRATSAPVPWARIWAIRGSTSSLAYVLATRSAKPESTSYGVARRPYTIRSASRVACRRKSGNAVPSAIPSANIESGVLRSPTRNPIETTTAP